MLEKFFWFTTPTATARTIIDHHHLIGSVSIEGGFNSLAKMETMSSNLGIFTDMKSYLSDDGKNAEE